MIKVIVGHRGVGKTSLLQRWKIYQPELHFFDLDSEIEKHTSHKISDYFEKFGELKFREIEIQVFLELIKNSNANTVISCGAGFDLSKMPNHVFVLWLRRDSDSTGRIFTDRPRLNSQLSALDEYHERFQPREMMYAKHCHFIYTMPEGLNEVDPEEKAILTGKTSVQAYFTLKPQVPIVNLDAVFEWRDDLLSETEFKRFDLKNKKILYSVRTNGHVPEIVKANQYPIDWDLNRPLPALNQIFYLSTHQDSIHQAIQILKPFEKSHYHLKLCPLVESWTDLELGFQWQQVDPSKRNFLPRSLDGKWDWFRLMMKSHQSLNFIRTGDNSHLDQPTLWQWLSMPNKNRNGMAAVLGAPVNHSFSPSFHKKFFLDAEVPFFKIHLAEEEWELALPLLEKWGLRFAAVTSPLKTLAGHWVGHSALNTLVRDNQTWKSENTDIDGFATFSKNLANQSVVVWGGGGLLEMLKGQLPDASFYSARSGKPRQGYAHIENPDVIIWAAGQTDMQLIPPRWQPQLILDLSYIENSVAREVAIHFKAKYKSGLEMFYVQAKSQQKFWQKFIK